MSLTNAEVARVLAARKLVTERIEWRARPGRTPKWECAFSVRIPVGDDPGLAVLGRIEATSNQYETRCAFIYAGICIRRWESRGRHRNPDKQWIVGAHKHLWDETDEDRLAYVPNDIDVTDRDTVLMSFLDECSITIGGAGGYAPSLPGFGGSQ